MKVLKSDIIHIQSIIITKFWKAKKNANDGMNAHNVLITAKLYNHNNDRIWIGVCW